MKVWTGRTNPCVFCEFRAIFRGPQTRIQSRQLHDRKPHPSRKLVEGIETREVGLEFRGSNRRAEALKKHFARDGKSKGFRRVEAAPDSLGVESRVGEATLENLPRLNAALRQARATDDSNVSQYDSLDPDRNHWPAFADNIKLLVRQSKTEENERWNAEQKKLWGKLVTANRFKHDRERGKDHAAEHRKVQDRSAEIRKVLHYAFVDHVLQNQQKHQSSFLAKFADLRYPTEWYMSARAAQRAVHLHVGPTNSGKTYNALKRLEEAGNGFYAGPLRLLAHEVYSRFRAKGIPCDLVTGDDVRRDDAEDVRLYASTVEMVDTAKEVDVAVIDEIQMMGQEDRGWAWTRAFLGANAKEVHLCGEARVIPLIKELAASMGDTLHIHEYDRLNPLKAMSRSLRGNLNNLRKGDCVVSFSVVGIHALKKQIEIETGRRVAIVYGSLPPETRAQQAALFNDPDNDYDYLVASNAIGMGLNLAIKRVVFETITKFNGVTKERLSIPEIKQIAGRAGRYRTAYQDAKTGPSSNPADVRKSQYHATASVGLVTCLDEADLPFIEEALRSEPGPLRHAGILPPTSFVEEYAARLPKGLPFEYILRRICEVAVLHPRYKLCDVRDQLGVIKAIESVKSMTVTQRCTFAASPADYRDPESQKVVLGFAKYVAENRTVTVADIPEIKLEVLERPISGDRDYLHALETLHKALVLFLWLSYRYIDVFRDQDMAFHAKEMVEEKINITLLEFSANPQLRKRLLALKMASVGMESASTTGDEPLLDPQSDEESNTGEVLDSPALPIDWAKGADEKAITSLEGTEGRVATVNS